MAHSFCMPLDHVPLTHPGDIGLGVQIPMQRCDEMDKAFYLVYLGERSGEFGVNSRVEIGKKYRVSYDKPFRVLEKDLWITSMQDFRLLSLVNFAPRMLRKPLPNSGYLPHYCAAFLEGLAANLPDPARVVEIGTGWGNSLIRILTGLALHEDAFVTTIDLVDRKEARKHLQECHIPNWQYEMIQGGSVEVAAIFDKRINMIYVDGSHSKVGVLEDIKVWEPKLYPKGLMLFDDYDEPLHEVTYAVDEAMFGHPEKWEFIGQVGRLVAFEKKG